MRHTRLSYVVLLLTVATAHAADVAAIKALAGGKEVRFVWTTFHSGTYNHYKVDFFTKINALDTRDNKERQICPSGDCNAANYLDPLFVSGGRQIVYSVGGVENKTYVMDWDGRNRRHLCAGQVSCPAFINGVQWIYFQKILHGPIYRINMANPSQEELVYDKRKAGAGGGSDNFLPWFHVSPDGNRAAFTTPPGSDGYRSGVAWLPCIGSTGKDTILGEHNCWNAISPDNTKHHWMYNGSHRDVTMFDSTLRNPWIVTFYPVQSFHKWTANDANLVIGTGPGHILTDDKPGQVWGQLYLGKLSNWKTIEWIRVTSNDASRNAWNDAWVGDTGTSSTPTVTAPVIAPATLSFADSVRVSITTATTGATIHYTITGADPTTASPVYSAQFTLKQSTTVKAFAVKQGMSPSPVTISAFTKNTVPAPAITPASGTFSDSVRVTITCADQAATIYYTTGSTDPTTSSTRYAGPVTIKASSTIKARAFSGSASSTVASATLTITTNDPIVIVAPNGGEVFRVGQTMTIRWTAKTSIVNNVSVFISVDAGLNWIEALGTSVGALDPAWGTYPWVIPATINDETGVVSLVSKMAVMRIQHYNDAGIFDESDAVFTIDPSSAIIRMPAAVSGRRAAETRVTLFDVTGVAVASATIDRDNTGMPVWTPADHSGRPLPAGTYVLRVWDDTGIRRTHRVTLSSSSSRAQATWMAR